MTIRFTLTLAVEGAAADDVAGTHVIKAVIERGSMTAEALGLTLVEGKAILAELQAVIVSMQVAAHEAAARTCRACGTDRGIKGHHPITCCTVFGTLPLKAMRLRRCRCGADPAAGDRASFSPLAELLPERTTPELLYLETRWGALVSYGLAARMLGDEPHRADWAWSGCQRNLDDRPPPDGPAYVGVDGGFVRDRVGSWFEVIAGKSIPGFRRGAPEDDPPRPAKCFAFVQAHDDRPRRRLLDVLAAQDYAPNQKLVLMSDGGESVRRLVARIGPEAEHVLDWFHITMRLTVLRQMTRGACPGDPGWTERRLCDLGQLKWLLWHGHARHAVDAAQELADDAWGRAEDAEGTETAEARGKLGRLHTAAEELATYLRRNAGQIVNYGERYRAGERISTGFVESAVNQVVSKRFSKKQSMRWTQAGAHLALQARTRVLNGELEDVFRRRWPGFQPSKAEPERQRTAHPLYARSPPSPH